MDTEGLLAPDTASPLGQSRAQVLDLLRQAGSPLGVQEVADRIGLHPNTARFHLDGLVEAGLATRRPQARATRGRPSIAYQATDGDGPSGGRRYRLLGEMLTSLIAAAMTEPTRAAEEAGREWGAYLTRQPAPYERPGADEAIEKLTAILAKLGFTPKAIANGRQYRLDLHQCPFREVAQHHQNIVCALHLGLMQGALTQMRAPVTADRLEPFAEPSLCVAHLTTRKQPDPTSQPGTQPDS